MEHGLSRYANYKCRCEICRQANINYQRVYQPKHRLATKEERNAYARERWRRDKEAIVAKERSAHGKALKRARQSGRRSRKLDQFIEDVDPRIVYEMHGGCCGICKDFVSQDNFHVDHIVPLSRGGMHGYVNVQPAHPFCNTSKHAQMPDELAFMIL